MALPPLGQRSNGRPSTIGRKFFSDFVDGWSCSPVGREPFRGRVIPLVEERVERFEG
jgi:hypothetical protein